ncbi:16212_t:CDS:2, partial [Entrophospora sp. SA101]
MYTQYCDCGKFINPVEPMEEKVDDDVILVESSKKAKKRSLPPQTAYYVTRGVELLDLNDGYVKIYTYKNRQEYSQNSEVNSNNINN